MIKPILIGDLKLADRPSQLSPTLDADAYYDVDKRLRELVKLKLVSTKQPKLELPSKELLIKGCLPNKQELVLVESPELVDCVHIKLKRKERQVCAESDFERMRRRLAALIEKVFLFEQKFESGSAYEINEIALHPLFVWYKADNMLKKHKYPSMHKFVQSLSKMNTGSFLLFLFIEAGHQEEYVRVVKKLMGIKADMKNHVVTVQLPGKNMGMGRIRKLMIMLASSLHMSRFYCIDDKINDFYEYNDLERKLVVAETPAKPLAFMSKVLTAGICNRDHEAVSNC